MDCVADSTNWGPFVGGPKVRAPLLLCLCIRATRFLEMPSWIGEWRIQSLVGARCATVNVKGSGMIFRMDISFHIETIVWSEYSLTVGSAFSVLSTMSTVAPMVRALYRWRLQG